MSTLTSFDSIISRIGAGYVRTDPIYGETQTTGVNLFTSATGTMFRIFTRQVDASLPGTATSYIPVSCMSSSSTQSILLMGKMLLIGTFNIGTNTFTHNTGMGTIKQGGIPGVSVTAWPVFEVTTALNATPGNITVTYTNQTGLTGQSSGSLALGASVPIGYCGSPTLSVGDFAVEDITSITQSGGTTPSGVLNIWGVVPLGMMNSNVAPSVTAAKNWLTATPPPYRLSASDYVGIFRINQIAAATTGSITYVGDN